MRFNRKSKYYFIICVSICFFLLAYFLIKANHSWRIKDSRSGVHNESTQIETTSLLNFKNRQPSWIVETNEQPILFDLFTSPNIYQEEDRFIMDPCTQWQFDTVFPLRLKAIVRKKYRLQFEGYVKTDSKSKFIIILHDLENNQTIRCEEGQKFNTLEIEILSFQIKTEEKEDMIVNTPMVKLFDSKMKEEIVLTSDTKYYDNKYDVILEDVDEVTHILPAINQEVKIGESSCILRSIDAKNNVIFITLIDANKQEFQKRLRLIQ